MTLADGKDLLVKYGNIDIKITDATNFISVLDKYKIKYELRQSDNPVMISFKKVK